MRYGTELIVDLFECEALPCTRGFIEGFLIGLCHKIGMAREDLHFWDYDGDPEGYANAPGHLKGISAVQFIRTSTVTIHTLDTPRSVYLNVFSCKAFDAQGAAKYAAQDFRGRIGAATVVPRLKGIAE